MAYLGFNCKWVEKNIEKKQEINQHKYVRILFNF